MKKKFYVYEWFNIETNEVFYVGKGCGNRYKSLKSRNQDFLDYIDNHPTNVRIVKYFDSEDDAYTYEKDLTQSYREKNQCSCCLMDGGYGGYSKVWTPEMKEYQSKYNPMKRLEQRERMSVNNPMKNPEIAKKVNSQKKRPVIINGQRFDGVIDAAIFFKVRDATVSNWCKRGYNTNGEPCRYEDEEQKAYTLKNKSAKEIIVDGNLHFNSLKEAAKWFGATDTSPLCKALKTNRPYHNHKVEYANQQPS